jgi:hypothetical protein
LRFYSFARFSIHETQINIDVTTKTTENEQKRAQGNETKQNMTNDVNNNNNEGSWTPILCISIFILLWWISYSQSTKAIRVRRWYSMKVRGAVLGQILFSNFFLFFLYIQSHLFELFLFLLVYLFSPFLSIELIFLIYVHIYIHKLYSLIVGRCICWCILGGTMKYTMR